MTEATDKIVAAALAKRSLKTKLAMTFTFEEPNYNDPDFEPGGNRIHVGVAGRASIALAAQYLAKAKVLQWESLGDDNPGCSLAACLIKANPELFITFPPYERTGTPKLAIAWWIDENDDGSHGEEYLRIEKLDEQVLANTPEGEPSNGILYPQVFYDTLEAFIDEYCADSIY